MSVATKNKQTKAFQSHLADIKSINSQAFVEWEIAFNTKPKTESEPERKVWGQAEICNLYPDDRGGHCGATKRTHVECHNGKTFQHIVIKRFKKGGHIFNCDGTGNQLIDEIKCWEKLADTADADCLCPILKYFTCKSDKVTAISPKMLKKVVIIAQKAEYVSNMLDCCREAEYRNSCHSLNGTPASQRADELKKLAIKMHWWDVERNPGNSGVIFDYEKRCYKAVFIDYAL